MHFIVKKIHQLDLAIYINRVTNVSKKIYCVGFK